MARLVSAEKKAVKAQSESIASADFTIESVTACSDTFAEKGKLLQAIFLFFLLFIRSKTDMAIDAAVCDIKRERAKRKFVFSHTVPKMNAIPALFEILVIRTASSLSIKSLS